MAAGCCSAHGASDADRIRCRAPTLQITPTGLASWWRPPQRKGEAMSAYGDCDCCDRKNVALAQAWIAGLETWACAVRRGEEPDEMNYVIFNSAGKVSFFGPAANHSDAKNVSANKRSGEPEIHATDSTWTGWTAKISVIVNATAAENAHRRSNAKIKTQTPE